MTKTTQTGNKMEFILGASVFMVGTLIGAAIASTRKSTDKDKE